ncbi:MAG TPA: hypothetical protein VNP03_07125 [Pseudonocardia sp.]|nr:hypothetical protein [Pseudonocardia sp.]
MSCPIAPTRATCRAGAAADLPVATWLAVPVGVVSGVGTAWWWGRRAYRRLAEQGPELLAALR